LGDGESTGLADHEVGPLYAHNRDKVTSLSVSQSLGCVANLGSRDNRSWVEGQASLGGPSADWPWLGFTTSEEKTNIDSIVLVAIPVKDGFEVLVIVVTVSILRHGAFNRNMFSVGISNVLVSSSISLVAWNRVWLVRIVSVLSSGHVSRFKSKSESSTRADTIIVKDIEVSEETSGGLDNTNLEVSEWD
jgi:hypothetical protein